MKKKVIKLLPCLLLLLCLGTAQAQQLTDPKKIAQLASTAIDSAYASSVQISAYDTLRKRALNGVFSGVVVSAEGHVLTVAHATKPHEVYQLSFPDGMKLLAKGMGRIEVKDSGARKALDLAMIKILTPGKWPFAKMASNKDMKVGQPAISISFPGSFFRSQPNVRFGRLADVDYSSNYFVSTCKMEPGDSGGPLFDAYGRLLGMHSWIERSEERNFEVPVELYLRYWTALNQPIDYKELPKEDDLPIFQDTRIPPVIPAIETLVSIPSKQVGAVVQVVSKRGGENLSILGTIVESQISGKTTSHIITKSAMVAANPVVIIGSRQLPARIIKRNSDNDLVLLKVEGKIPSGIKLSQDSIPLSKKNLGSFLVSGLAGGAKKVGVLSSTYTEMPMRFSVGYFGANATFIDQKITITDITRRSPAESYLKLKDQVTGINGKAISKPAEYGAELMKYLAGDSITVELVRDQSPMQVKMYLPAYPGANHVASKFDGGRSARSDGFKRVLIQDAAIKVDECGGPVFDAVGRFYGINIARHSRTSTIVMPVDVLIDFIK